jgi:hypothetical protein
VASSSSTTRIVLCLETDGSMSWPYSRRALFSSMIERAFHSPLWSFSSYEAPASSCCYCATHASHSFRPHRRQQSPCLHFSIRHDERVADVAAVEAQQPVIPPHTIIAEMSCDAKPPASFTSH